MSSTSDKKKEKFNTVLNAYERIEQEKIKNFLACNGFPSSLKNTKKKRKKKEVSKEDKSAFTDEMLSVLYEYMYDAYLIDESVERDHTDIGRRHTLYDILKLGPDAYISMVNNLPAEGENEGEEKNQMRSRYLPSKLDIKRFAGLGGAVEMSQEAKNVLSTIIRACESGQIQKASALSNSNHGRVTIMQRDLITGHKIAGYDTVSV
jgi:hypothetical protein